MNKIVGLRRFVKRRFEKFHQKCIECCDSKNRFYRHFEIDSYHITAQGLKKDIKRLSITAEDTAALIQQGSLNLDHCEEKPKLRIAIEGNFEEFEWLNIGNGAMQIEPMQEVRVIVEERKPKSLVVTVYTIRPPLQYKVPIVNREVW